MLTAQKAISWPQKANKSSFGDFWRISAGISFCGNDM
jgi:hypothetical protein